MGGFGSTRWEFHFAATTTADCAVLDLMDMTKAESIRANTSGSLKWPAGGSVAFAVRGNRLGLQLELTYTHTAERDNVRTDVELLIQLESTTPHFGGVRWWAQCPVINNGRPCRRRVRKLYLAPGCPYFGCRACHRLVYASGQRRYRKTDARLPDTLAEATVDDFALHGDAAAGPATPDDELRSLRQWLSRAGDTSTETAEKGATIPA